MAKKNSQGRVRVFFAEIEGDDETIQDGLKAMASAVNKTFQPKVVNIYRNQPLELPGEESAGETDDTLEDLAELEENTIEGEFVDRKKRNKSGKKRKPPTMSLIRDLDFRPEGGRAWRRVVRDRRPRRARWRRRVGRIIGPGPLRASGG